MAYSNKNPNEHVFTLFETACVIVEVLPSEIVRYFEHKIVPVPEYLDHVSAYLQIWTEMNSSAPESIYSPPKDVSVTQPTLINLVFCELCSALSQNNEVDARVRCREQHRSRKKYMYRQLREEMGELPIQPQNKRFLEEEWKALNSPYVRNILEGQYSLPFLSDDSHIPDKDSYMKSRYATVTAWYKDKNSYLFDFPFFDSFPIGRRFDNYVVELMRACLDVICENYYRNKFGWITRTLDSSLSLTEYPLFSWQASTVNLNYEINNNVMQIFEEINLSPQHSLKIIVYEEPFEEDLATAPSVFDAICQEMEGGSLHRALDTFDSTILTAVLNNLSLSAHSAPTVVLNLADFAQDVYGETTFRARDYERLIRHIIKLGKTSISSTTSSDNGTFLASSNMSFFNYAFKNISSDISEMDRVCTTINIASGDAKLDFSALKVKDYESMEVTFFISAPLYNTWSSSMHTYISSTLYRQIESTRGKALMQMLQEERVRIFPAVQTFIPFAKFREYFKITGKMARFQKELVSELNNLSAHNGAVSSYDVTPQGVTVSFLPLSTAERKAYRIE